MTKEMIALNKQAHHGDAESMFQLAIRAYWEYEQEYGLDRKTPIFNLLIAAGQHGDGAMNRKIGDFFRNEFQEDLAQTHYQAALEKDLELAAKGDAAAQYAVAEQYAIGLGIPQDDEKAAFWLQQAARSGHKAARDMMVNLWQDGTVMPINAAMANKWQGCGSSLPQTSSADLTALRQAAVNWESAADQLDVEQRLASKKRPVYKVTDLAQTPSGLTRNTIYDTLTNLVQNGYLILAFTSLIGFFTTIFTGYRESGLFHILNRIFYIGLNIPMRILLLLTGGVPFSETTLESFCTLFYYDLSSGNIFGKLIELIIVVAFCLVLFGIWLYVFFFVVYFACEFLFQNLEVRGLHISTSESINNQKQISQLKEALEKAEHALSRLLQQYVVPSELHTSAALLGLYDYASFHGISDIRQAVDGYLAMLEQEEEPNRSVWVADRSSHLVHYFVMHRLIPGSSAYAGICSEPQYNFNPSGLFMDGYFTYRRGKDFKSAEDSFRQVLKTKPNTPEAGFAAWNLSAICGYEHLSVFAYEKERDAHNQKCMEEAESMRKLAAQYGCPYAKNDGVSSCIHLWQGRYNAMMSLADYFSGERALYDYYVAMAKADLDRTRECGNPLDEAQWNGYDTKCTWAIYKTILAEYEKSGGEKALQKLSARLFPLREYGVYQITELKKVIDDKLHDMYLTRQLEYARMQERNRDEFLRRQAWEEQRDEYERERNLLLSSDPRTDFERYMTDDLSASLFDASQTRRNNARDKFLDENEG